MGNKRGTATLKQRIVVMFLCCVLLVFGGILVVSGTAMRSILRNKIDAGYQSGVSQLCMMLENAVNNLNHVAQQLAGGNTLGDLNEYLNTQDPYIRIQAGKRVGETLNVVTFTNPNVGLALLADAQTGDLLFYNAAVSAPFDTGQAPVLFRYGRIRYLGPYPSRGASRDRMVLAAAYEAEMNDERRVVVYVETSFRLLDDLLAARPGGERFPILFLDGEGNVVYSQDPVAYPVGTHVSPDRPTPGRHAFYQSTSQGFSIVSLVPDAVYWGEWNHWMRQMVLLCLGVMALCVGMALALWRKIYRPLELFDRRIADILTEDIHNGPERTGVPEYDQLLMHIEKMKGQIRAMIDEISHQEQQRAEMEIEKLRYQINPHFLMNTLNTVHWMAVMAKQNDIDNVIQALNRLLSYNLSLENRRATLEQELAATKQYLTLQQVRHDFTFSFETDASEEALGWLCPKFILQPIVENALYHGYRTHMHIITRVSWQGEGFLKVDITDDGVGMSENKLEELLGKNSTDEKPVGMGIGLRYVVQMVGRFYEGRGKIVIDSQEGKGTSVCLLLPKTEESLC